EGAQGALRPVTLGGNHGWGIWTADGGRITYGSNRVGTSWDIFWRPADGSGVEEPLVQRELAQYPLAWSPDGQTLPFGETNSTSAQDIWLLSLKAPRAPRPFARTPASEQDPAFSPDSQWLAFVSNQSGRPEVYVRPASGTPGEWRLSMDGGTEP